MTKKKILFGVIFLVGVLILIVFFLMFNLPNTTEKDNNLNSLKIVNIEDGSTQEYDVSMAIEKGICKDNKIDDNFLNMQALYKKVFDSYLYSVLDIKKYDKILSENELPIIPDLKEGNKELSLSYMPSEYICGLNTIHVERLDRNSVKLLQKYLDNNNTEINNELLALVADTFPVVLSTNAITLNRFRSRQFSLKENTLVLGISHYPEFDEKGDFVDINKDKLRRKFVNELALEMQDDFLKKLDYDILVLAII